MIATSYHASKDALAPERMDRYETRRADFGEFAAAFESIPAGFPPGGEELYRGLPEQACQVPHWGYLFRGRMKFIYQDGSEQVVGPGEAYYAPPGHRWEVLEDAETIEFSPAQELDEHLRTVARNLGERAGDPAAT
jgi:hypothetical protein